jgi:arginase family enzyme
MLLSTQDIRKLGAGGVSHALAEWIGASSAYISVDMDVIEPGLAPAVGNPSPEGITVTTLLDIMQGIASPKIVGFDLTEVTPLYDSGTTAAQAAHIVLEAMYLLESVRE